MLSLSGSPFAVHWPRMKTTALLLGTRVEREKQTNSGRQKGSSQTDTIVGVRGELVSRLPELKIRISLGGISLCCAESKDSSSARPEIHLRKASAYPGDRELVTGCQASVPSQDSGTVEWLRTHTVDALRYELESWHCRLLSAGPWPSSVCWASIPSSIKMESVMSTLEANFDRLESWISKQNQCLRANPSFPKGDTEAKERSGN